MKKISLLALSIIVLFSCDDNNNPFDIQGRYPSDQYPTESFNNYTLNYVEIKSAHEDGFVPLLNQVGFDEILLDPGDNYNTGQSYKVRKNTDMSFYISTNISPPEDSPNPCSLRHKKIPQGEGWESFVFTANIFWCEEEFGENGPNVYSSDVLLYDRISFTNHTSCDIKIIPTNIPDSSKPSFYDEQGVRELNDLFVQPHNDNLLKLNEYRSQPNLQWNAEFTDSCNDCTLRFSNRKIYEGSPTNYYFWCVEEFGEEGPY